MNGRTSGPELPKVTLGADGWRGRIGWGFSVASASAVGRAVAETLAAQGAIAALVSHDARELSGPAAAAVAKAAAAHMDVTLVAYLPTPVASGALRAGQFDAAILVTASHNPADWNGVKVRVAPGVPVDREIEQAIEQRLADPACVTDIAFRVGRRNVRGADAASFVTAHIDAALDRVGSGTVEPNSAHVVVDGLHGIAGAAMTRMCRALGWRTHELGTTPHQRFHSIIPDPVRVDSRTRVSSEVRRLEADFGIIVDGDGDRIWIIDEWGEAIQPATLFTLLLRDELATTDGTVADEPVNDTRPPVAVTVSCGITVNRFCAEFALPVVERPVGFKHIAPSIADGEVWAGAGGVGDLAVAPYCIDRDPMAVLALFARLLRHETTIRPGKLAKRLADHYGQTYREERHIPGDYTNHNLHQTGQIVLKRLGMSEHLMEVTDIDGAKFRLNDESWVLLRSASTEGGVRIFTETSDAMLTKTMTDAFESAFS